MIKTILHDKKGTTLIELIVVMGIVAILAGISMGAYHKFIVSAKKSATMATLDSVKTTILSLEIDTLLWPGLKSADNCKADGDEYADLMADNIGLFNNNGNFPGWDGPYLASIFLDKSGNFTDAWGTPYFMDCDYLIGGVNYVVVGSFGPNGVGMNNYDADNLYVIVSTDEEFGY